MNNSKLSWLLCLLFFMAVSCQAQSDIPEPIAGATLSPNIVDIASIDSIDVDVSDRVLVQMTGTFDDDCSSIHTIDQSRTQKNIRVTVTETRPRTTCNETVIPFNEVFVLETDGLPNDTYTINVNGLTDNFELGPTVALLPDPTQESTDTPSLPDPTQESTDTPSLPNPTQESADTPTKTPFPTNSPTQTPTNTTTPTLIPSPIPATQSPSPATPTLAPTEETLDPTPTIVAESAETCIDLGIFGEDVTIPDNTLVEQGERFQKIWRLINTGNCIWTREYTLSFIAGNQFDAPDEVNLPIQVLPGESVNISVFFTASDNLGTARSNWKLIRPDDQEVTFTDSQTNLIWTQIEIVPAGTLGTISGFVWNDFCDNAAYIADPTTVPAGCFETDSGTVRGDGVFSAQDEDVLQGVEVLLGRGDCERVEFFTSTITDLAGQYTFAHLVPDTYCVFIDVFTETNSPLLIPGTTSFPRPGFNSVTVEVTAEIDQDQINFGWDFLEE